MDALLACFARFLHVFRPSFAESKQHHLHPFQARQVVAHALHALKATDVAPGLNPVSDFTRLLALSTNDTTRSNHATSPRGPGLAQRQLQLTCDFCVAWDLGFERAAPRNKCATASNAMNGKLGSGPRVVVHGHVRLNHVVGVVRLQVRPVHLGAVAGGKHHRVVGPLGVQRREQLSLGFGARVKASRELASAFLKEKLNA